VVAFGASGHVEMCYIEIIPPYFPGEISIFVPRAPLPTLHEGTTRCLSEVFTHGNVDTGVIFLTNIARTYTRCGYIHHFLDYCFS